MQTVPAPEYRNFLLNALSPEALRRVAPHLRPVSLPLRAVPHTPDDAIEAVHFIESGYVSQIVTLAEGDAVEVGLVGREGMIGLPLLFQVERTPLESLVQVAGHAWRMEAAAFHDRLGDVAEFRTLMLRYAMTYHM